MYSFVILCMLAGNSYFIKPDEIEIPKCYPVRIK